MKATCYVAVIAIVIIDIFWTVSEESDVRSRLYGLGGKMLLLVIAFCLASWCRQGMYQTLHYGYNPELEIGWSNYMYNGLNEDTTGACSGEALRSYGLLPVPIRLPGCNMNLQESAGECRTGAL